MRTIMKMQASLGFAKVFSPKVSKSQFCQNFLPPKFCAIRYSKLLSLMHGNLFMLDVFNNAMKQVLNYQEQF